MKKLLKQWMKVFKQLENRHKKTALPELMSTTKCTQRNRTKHTRFILGRSNIRYPQPKIEFEKLYTFIKYTQTNPVTLPHTNQHSHFATPLHYLTPANSRTLPPRYITPHQPTLALCRPVTLPHTSQLSHFATPLHYPTPAKSRILQSRYITPHQPTLALCHPVI